MLYKPQLPSDWHYIRIGDCCDILDNQRIPVNSEERWKRQGTIPYYGANGQQGWIDDYIFNEELVLIAEDGGFFDEYETRPIAYIINGKSWVNNHAHVLRAKEITTNHWVFYNLVHKDIRFYIKGGTRSKLNQSELREIEIPLCSIDEQHKIIKILLDIDKVISKTEQLIAKLKQIKAGLLHDLLTYGLDENGELRDPIAHPEKFKDSPFGLIPAEWALTPLEDVASRQPNSLVDGPFGSNLKTTEYSDEGVRLVQLQNIGEGFWHDDNRKFIPETKFQQLIRHAAYPGDIVIAKMADPIARACLLPEVSDRFLVVADCIKLTVDTSKYDPHFIVYAINHRNFRSRAEKTGTGTTRQRINLSTLKKLILAIPPSSEQVRIVKVLKLHDEFIQSEQAYLNKLRLLQKGLMHDLLTGKVRVPLDREGN